MWLNVSLEHSHPLERGQWGQLKNIAGWWRAVTSQRSLSFQRASVNAERDPHLYKVLRISNAWIHSPKLSIYTTHSKILETFGKWKWKEWKSQKTEKCWKKASVVRDLYTVWRYIAVIGLMRNWMANSLAGVIGGMSWQREEVGGDSWGAEAMPKRHGGSRAHRMKER